MPSIGEMSLVKPRFTLAVSTAAAAAVTPASAASICALAVSTCALRRGHLRLQRLVGLPGVVQILLCDGLLLGQWNVAILVHLRLALVGFRARELRLCLNQSGSGLRQLCLGLRQLSDCLIGRGLQRPRVDLKQQLSFADEGTFGVVLREQVSGHLRLDGSVDHAVQSADPFALDRQVLLCHCGYLDVRRRRSTRRSRLFRTTNGWKHSHAKQQHRA